MVETRRRYAEKNMPAYEDEESLLPSAKPKRLSLSKVKRNAGTESERDPAVAIFVTLIMTLALLLGLVYWLFFHDSAGIHALPVASPCDTPSQGYQCDPALSHSWGQYSPYFLVPSEVSTRPPSGCKIVFAQLLSRHGARFPTAYKTVKYNETIAKVKSSATNYTGPYEFLQTYGYDLGADDLTPLGRQQLINSGVDFFTRYETLAETNTPFVRAGDQKRIVESAKYWTLGFHKAKIASGADRDEDYPYDILEISEADDKNNTLSHGLCTAFEVSKTGLPAMETFGETFLPEITARLKRDLQAHDLEDLDSLSLMDLCPFTVAAETSFAPSPPSQNPSLNPFCALFTQDEWEKYDYVQSIGKYYGFGPGAPLGPTQGVGFVNELIARLTSSPVQDHTSVNQTLDSDPATFPLGRKLYADFSHDNDMTAIFSAMGLFEHVPQLSKQRVMDAEETGGYAAGRSVPFAGRAVVEKMECEGMQEELVRVVLNGRVWPLETCGAHEKGMCTLGKFVESLSFAREGGRWGECFTVDKIGGTIVDVDTS